jgi:hypothetical protein
VSGVEGADGAGRRRAEVGSFLELFALSGLVFAQPLLDVFSRAPEVFVASRAGVLDIVAFALVVAVGPPLALWVVGRLVGLAGPGPRQWAHLVAVAALAALLLVQVVRGVSDVRRAILVVPALLAGGLLAWALARTSVARTFLRYLAVAPVAFVALFLLASPVSRILLAEGRIDAATTEVGRPAPVVMIVLDELPTTSLLDGEGAIDADLYPNLAALAGDGTWYRNHTTVAAHTKLAVPSIVTGRWPEGADRPATAAEHPQSLFTLLGGTYDLEVLENFTHLCPEQLCDAGREPRPGSALPGLLSAAAGAWTELTAPEEDATLYGGDDPFFESERAHRRFDLLIESFDRMTDRSLHYLHVLLPHQPWNWLPSGQRHTGPFEGFFGSWITDDTAESARQRHILQMQFTDRQVGRVLDRLRELDRYDDALVVLTADHGVSFTPGEPLRALSNGNAIDLLWVPLIVKAPGRTEGEVRDHPSGTVDILPTMADHLAVEVPWEVDGGSLREDRSRTGGQLEVFDLPDDLVWREGAELEVDGDETFAAVLGRRAVRHDGPPELSPYRLGPHGPLVGVPVAQLEVGPPSPVGMRLDDPRALDDVDTRARTLPVYIPGEAEGDEPVTVAVAVNGVVGGVFTTIHDEERQRFWVIVPPSLLVDGRNEVELFGVDGAPGSERLLPAAPA